MNIFLKIFSILKQKNMNYLKKKVQYFIFIEVSMFTFIFFQIVLVENSFITYSNFEQFTIKHNAKFCLNDFFTTLDILFKIIF